MLGPRPRPLVAGNWKMNGLSTDEPVFIEILDGYSQELRGLVDLLVCPPATLVGAFAARAGGQVAERVAASISRARETGRTSKA